jgi:hypothetical protein
MSQITADDRTTALGLFNYAQSYRAAADCLLSAELKTTHPQAPMTFLYYHAIELYLKAHLRSQGLTVAELRQVSHNISKLAAAVESRGLVLEDEDKEVLSLMAEADNIIRSRYIQTGTYSRPEEEALSRTCAALDEAIAASLIKLGITVRPYSPAPVSPAASNLNAEADLREELSELNAKEREIIAYLVHHNERLFTADIDGGHAATLIARGFVRVALRPGQVFDSADVPMEVPRPVWNVVKQMKEQFPYSGDEDDPHPWRVGFYDRV